jgi:hypothetical protein
MVMTVVNVSFVPPLSLLCSQCTEYKFASEISHFYLWCGISSKLIFFPGFCPTNCNGHGTCLSIGICECENGFAGVDCSTGKGISFYLLYLFICYMFCWLIICLIMVKLHTTYFLVAFMFFMFKLPFLKQLFCVNWGKEIQRAMLYILRTCLEKRVVSIFW